MTSSCDIRSDIKLFESKLNSSSKKILTASVHRAGSLKRKPTIARAHNYINGKYIPTKLSRAEEEVWSRVAQKLLESILKKALAFNQTDSHLVAAQTTSSTMLLTDSNHTHAPGYSDNHQNHHHHHHRHNHLGGKASGNVTRLLFEEANFDEHFKPTSVISGANINHNCTHVNKHGVVIDTDDDFPPWLVKAMTCLMNCE